MVSRVRSEGGIRGFRGGQLGGPGTATAGLGVEEGGAGLFIGAPEEDLKSFVDDFEDLDFGGIVVVSEACLRKENAFSSFHGC